MARSWPFSQPSGIHLVPEASGVNNLGSASMPFNTIYVNNIVPAVSGSGGNFVPLSGGQMYGPLVMSGVVAIETNSIYDNGQVLTVNANTSGININAGSSSIVAENDLMTLQTQSAQLHMTGPDVLLKTNNSANNITMNQNTGVTINVNSSSGVINLINLDSSARIGLYNAATIPTSVELKPDGNVWISGNVLPNNSGTQSLGSAAKPWVNVYADNFIGSSGAYLPLVGGSLSGPLTGTSITGNQGYFYALNADLPISVPDGGGLVSRAAGEQININASFGLSIGGGSGTVQIGTSADTSVQGATSATLVATAGPANIFSTTQINVNNSIVPTVSGVDNIGSTGSAFDYGYIDNLVTSSIFINNRRPLVQNAYVITVSSDGSGDFTTVGPALAHAVSVGPSSAQNIVIWVNAGTYVESSALVIPQYVSIVGINMETVFIKPPALFAGDFITMSPDSNISFVSIEHDGSVGSRGIVGGDSGLFIDLHKVYIKQFDMGITIENVTANVEAYWYLEYVSIDCPFGIASTYALSANSDLGGTTYVQVNTTDLQQYSTTVNPNDAVVMQGADVEWVAQGLIINGDDSTTGNGINIFNGAQAKLGNVFINAFGTGLQGDNTGAGPTLNTLAFSIKDCTTSINLLQPSSVGAIFGGYDRSTATIPAGVTTLAMDNVNFATFQTGEFYSGPDVADLTEIAQLWRNGSTMGVLSGGTLSGTSSSLYLDIAPGYGYLEDATQLKKYTWAATGITIPANSVNYVYFNNNGILSNAGSRPSLTNNIYLGRVQTEASGVYQISQSRMNSRHTSNLNSEFARDVFGAIFEDGCITSSSGLNLSVTDGEFYYGENKYEPYASGTIAFDLWNHTSSGTWTYSTGNTAVGVTDYDLNGSGVIAIPASQYVKHSLYVAGDGADQKYLMIMAQASYSGLTATVNASTNTRPPNWGGTIIPIADIVVQQGASIVTEILDTRTRPSFAVGSNQTAITVHANLQGLSSDDHTQYLLVAGSREMSGDLGLGGNDVFNTNNITLNNGGSLLADVSGTNDVGSALKPFDTIYANNIVTTGVIGVSGYSGYSGYSGGTGSNGASGTSGFSGYTGVSGYSGGTGSNGASGTSGFSGYTGVSGYSGYTGVSGYSGTSGASGLSGFSGFKGAFTPATTVNSGIATWSGTTGQGLLSTPTTVDVNGNITLPAGISVLSASSGTGFVGAAATPFSSLYTKQIDGRNVLVSVFNEIPSGNISSGTNKTFTLVNAPSNSSIQLFKNGMYMTLSGLTTNFDFALAGSTITFVTAPASGSTLIANYGYYAY
jgi:hypothetical protein